jgi:predicted alpha/beta hydrolase
MPAAIEFEAAQPTRNVASRSVAILTEDGRTLGATLFEPQNRGSGIGPLTVIAAGAGMPQRYFGRFATYLAQHGRPALTFDYRDIGASRSGTLKNSSTRMRDWCVRDVPAVIAWARTEFSDRPLHWVGHSMGGFATGLAHNNRHVARQLNVGTLNGYWGRMASPERYRVRLLMGNLGVPVARLLGYLPGFLMGGEDMPGPAFIEWAGWCMTPDFIFGDPTLTEVEHFAHFRAPIRFAQIEDDVWGTPAAVDAIAGRFTANTEKSIWRVRLADAGASKIGHHGFFRDQFRDTLWPEALAWLDGLAAA